MPIHFRENQYNGVNAHLHSLLQRDGGGGEMFHNAHITHLTDLLDLVLPENYYVLNEKSLQLGFIDVDTLERELSRTRPDLAIYGEPSSTALYSGTAATPTAVFPLAKLTVEDDPLFSVVIRHVISGGEALPVTRIELLSPANKAGGSHYHQYVEKRQETLESGINLIELDYLHELRPVINLLPNYRGKEPDAQPYAIYLSNPHPSFSEGRVGVYGFGVDEPIPIIEVPLADDDAIVIDFGAIYQHTFARNRYYSTKLVDYTQLPVNFEFYTEADQQRIRERMKLAQQKAAQ